MSSSSYQTCALCNNHIPEKNWILHSIACRRFQKQHEAFGLIDMKLEDEKKTSQAVHPKELAKLEDIMREVEEAFPEEINQVRAPEPSTQVRAPEPLTQVPAPETLTQVRAPAPPQVPYSKRQKYDDDDAETWECRFCTRLNTSQFIQCQTCELFAVDELNDFNNPMEPTIPEPKPQKMMCLNDWD